MIWFVVRFGSWLPRHGSQEPSREPPLSSLCWTLGIEGIPAQRFIQSVFHVKQGRGSVSRGAFARRLESTACLKDTITEFSKLVSSKTRCNRLRLAVIYWTDRKPSGHERAPFTRWTNIRAETSSNSICGRLWAVASHSHTVSHLNCWGLDQRIKKVVDYDCRWRWQQVAHAGAPRQCRNLRWERVLSGRLQSKAIFRQRGISRYGAFSLKMWAFFIYVHSHIFQTIWHARHYLTRPAYSHLNLRAPSTRLAPLPRIPTINSGAQQR